MPHSRNGAPAHEPEVWDENVHDYNPRFGREPRPAPVEVAPGFDVAAYLREERAKDLFRFSTAGSVDDGKSTLIGRLLYDTQSVYEDQVRSIEGKGTTAPGVLDLALLTDGLRAEREQGITIDVAYRYFSTAHRKFIIADTPGHEQYTRNMATGASTADAAVVLLDARKGVLPQSRRHAAITALLAVPEVAVAVNKMDLVGWSREVFEEIAGKFRAFFAGLDSRARLHFIPVSALAGDNVVQPSARMPWYTGPILLELLEGLPPSAYADSSAPFRFAVQRVVRPDLDFRGFAGQIAAGSIRVGAPVVALPSGRRSRVARIVTFDGDLSEASAPLSVTLTLKDEIDLSRGDMLAAPDAPAEAATRLTASLVWMDQAPLDPARRYLAKQTSRTVSAYVRSVAGGAALGLNGIATVEIETLQPLAVDRYERNRHTGSLILIDPETNATVAAGMIRAVGAVRLEDAPVTAEERAARWGHAGAFVELAGPAELAHALERALLRRGAFVLRADLPEAARAGALVLVHTEAPEAELILDGRPHTLTGDAQAAVDEALALLGRAKVLRKETGR